MVSYLEKTIKLIDISGRIEEDIGSSDAKEIIKVINTYANALTLLDDYDHKTVIKLDGITDSKQITYAQSNPKEKEILVDLVMNFLKEN